MRKRNLMKGGREGGARLYYIFLWAWPMIPSREGSSVGWGGIGLGGDEIREGGGRSRR